MSPDPERSRGCLRTGFRFFWKAAVTVFVGMLACELLDCAGTGLLTRWTPTPLVAVDSVYAVKILTTPSSWILAEYDRKIEILELRKRRFESVGTVDLPGDAGAATRILLYTYTAPGGNRCVLLRDRSGVLRADLSERTGLGEAFQSGDEIRLDLRYLGMCHMRAWPRVFIPAAVLSEADAIAELQKTREPEDGLWDPESEKAQP